MFTVSSDHPTGNLFLNHKRVTVIGWRDEDLFDRAGADPTHQDHHRSGFIVRTARSRTSERLLPDDGAGRLVVNIEIARSKPKNAIGFGDGCPTCSEHATRQTVRGRFIDGGQRLYPLVFRIYVQSN